jgi:hypothetical protein
MLPILKSPTNLPLPKGINIPDLLCLTRTDDHDVFGCSIIYPFVYKAKTARHRNNLWKGKVIMLPILKSPTNLPLP